MSDLKQVNPVAAITQVEVFDNGTSLGVVPLPEDGRWSWIVNNLADGEHSFTARVVDTTITSAAWRVSVPVLPRTEDFESNRQTGHLPRGTILSYPTMEVEMFGDDCEGLQFVGDSWPPFIVSYVVQGAHRPGQSNIAKAVEYRFRRPVRHLRCGMRIVPNIDYAEVRCYDDRGVQVAIFQGTGDGRGQWLEFTSLESPIFRIDSYCKYHLMLDNFTLDY